MNLPVWLHNLLNLPFVFMARILEKKGWVVFYLDSPSRECNGGICWMKLYEEERIRRKVIKYSGG